ncbi:MAG: hypothetical protein ACRDEA_02140 [Microcystaceae cyanobacterium]
MAYLEIQTIKAFGIPYTEYRYAPEPTDIQIVTIEFIPDPDCLNNYAYPQPQYTFTQTVALRKDWEGCQRHHLDWREDLQFYEVCTLRLIQPKSKLTRRLTEAPFWLYGLQREGNPCDVLWAEEEELISQREIEQIEEDLNEF